MLVAVESRRSADDRKLPPVAGNAEEMYRKAAAGRGLIVSDNLAQLQRLQARRHARDPGARTA